MLMRKRLWLGVGLWLLRAMCGCAGDSHHSIGESTAIKATRASANAQVPVEAELASRPAVDSKAAEGVLR